MDIIKAKKLFAPPDKPDATKNHLILKVNQGFEDLAMELCDLIPKFENLDSFVQELHRTRLAVVFDIEHAKTGKQTEETPLQAKAAAKRTKKESPITPTQKTNDEIIDNGEKNEEMEGFE